jgi:hypothetical protein
MKWKQYLTLLGVAVRNSPLLHSFGPTSLPAHSAMTFSIRPLSLCTFGLFVALGLSLSVAQAAQDGRGRGRGPSKATPTQKELFFKICDHDGNKWISFREANYSLRMDRTKFGSIDTDSDARISEAEFNSHYTKTTETSGSFKQPLVMPGSSSTATTSSAPIKATPVVKPKSFKELFGAKETQEELPNTVPLPPRIEGPVAAFTRLDLNGDGKITLDDLDGLARPIHLDVRFPAVIAILDKDRDGGVSPSEFYASMR